MKHRCKIALERKDQLPQGRHQNGKISFHNVGEEPTFKMCLKYPAKLHVAGAISQRAASDCLVFQGNMEAQFCTSKVLVGTLRPFTVESFLEGHCFGRTVTLLSTRHDWPKSACGIMTTIGERPL